MAPAKEQTKKRKTVDGRTGLENGLASRRLSCHKNNQQRGGDGKGGKKKSNKIEQSEDVKHDVTLNGGGAPDGGSGKIHALKVAGQGPRGYERGNRWAEKSQLAQLALAIRPKWPTGTP